MSVLRVTHRGSCGARFHIPKDLKKFKCPDCSHTVQQPDLIDVEEAPSPLSPSVQGYSLIVKPTFTTWEKSNRNSFLHIGISNSQGTCVYHFLGSGAQKHDWNGQHLICIPLSPPDLITWDQTLTSHFSAEKCRQGSKPYHTLNNNCYDYVVRFLNSISYGSSNNHTKEEIVEKWIAGPVGAAELFSEWVSNAKAGRLAPFPSFSGCEGESFQCDICEDCFGPQSVRFRCKVCPDYDLCPNCFEGNSHQHKDFLVRAVV